MPTLKEVKGLEKDLKKAGLWDAYKDARTKFIRNPNLKSLDFCIWDRINRTWSIKITVKIRIIMAKRPNNQYEAFIFGDFHRKQAKK